MWPLRQNDGMESQRFPSFQKDGRRMWLQPSFGAIVPEWTRALKM